MKSARKILPGTEQHIQGTWLRDVILGGQDGLVNVLGIVLGVSTAGGNPKVIITASLAAAFAEAVSMGAVAYTSAIAQKDFYEKELQRETKEIEMVPEIERKEIRDIYEKRGFLGDDLEKVVNIITSNKKVWLRTMMDEELRLQPVDVASVLKSSAVVGIAALLGSFIPIFPFVFHLASPVVISLTASSLALFAVGIYQAKTFVGSWWKSGMQMVLIGMGAALVGFVIGKIFNV